MQRSASTRRPVPIWVIPLIYVVVSAFAGLAFPRIEHVYLRAQERSISVASAQAFLSAASSGMMALTAIAFSIAFLVLQFSTTAYSKRLVLLSGQSRIIAHALGMCFATFVYALATLTWVDRFHNGEVPTISSWLVVVLMVVSLVLLALLVHSLADLRVTRVLRTVGDKARAVIAGSCVRRAPENGAAKARLQQQAASVLAGIATQAIRYSGPPRSVVYVDIDALVTCAVEGQAVIELQCAVGDTLSDGTPLARAFGIEAAVAERNLLQAIHLGAERTFEGDPRYSLRLLVDTAIMALSPAVNDPTTAVQALDEIEDLLHRLGCSELDNGYVADRGGDLRVIAPMPTWEDYLSLALDEIRIYGAGSLQVLRRLHSALVDLSGSLEYDDRKSAVQRYLTHLDEEIERSNLEPWDRMTSLQQDRQGLGLTRQ